MKKCPFCKAEIEDNARFCLYCMKPLNKKEVILPPQKKKQWWPLAVAGALLLVLLLGILLILKGQNTPQGETTGGESAFSTQTIGFQATESTDETTQPETPEQNTTLSTDPEETTTETTEPEGPQSEVVYTYRAARAGDDFNANYANSGNDIVITGISQQSADGTYDIPSYIDGKKVIAIVANAFFESNAKTVYVPATVKTIWNYAFNGCALTDIYFRGNAIYVENKAFSGPLTIHCSASCSDRDLRYYKNSAANYGATWEEWNG